MYQPKLEKELRCPLEYGLHIFDGKWKVRIICALYEIGNLRYGQLKKKMGTITDAVLTSTLKELIAEDIVIRRQYEEIPPRVEYALSEKGHSAIPMLHTICEWSEAHSDDTEEYQFIPCSDCKYIQK